MQSVEGDESVRTRMAEMRLICDREIPIQQQRMDSALLSFQKSLHSSKSKAQETLELQGPHFLYFYVIFVFFLWKPLIQFLEINLGFL